MSIVKRMIHAICPVLYLSGWRKQYESEELAFSVCFNQPLRIFLHFKNIRLIGYCFD